jgi:hypothetical protein
MDCRDMDCQGPSRRILGTLVIALVLIAPALIVAWACAR